MPRPPARWKTEAARKACPRRHDGVCRVTGEHDKFCPDTTPAVVPHDEKGRFLAGQSGNRYGLKSLRAARKYMREELDGGRDLLDHMFFLAGLRPGVGGAMAPPFSVQGRVAIKLADIFFGKEIRHEHEVTGTLKHEAKVVPEASADEAWLRTLSDEELAMLEQVHRKRQALLEGPREDVEDAVIEAADSKEEA